MKPPHAPVDLDRNSCEIFQVYEGQVCYFSLCNVLNITVTQL